ncbi:ABC transporter permease [Aliidongia dinghuensis]|uniref:ABC transporter permease n=1 Tax=Aliidongia dinghuensis TaxID=1867774 RepID=A0A8J2YQZ4_9PROT|nr:ABC transporter permease [Aliidongia dinghuensis]GGF05865.1 ABC transporter permease [Aliidongia dinghuensis]
MRLSVEPRAEPSRLLWTATPLLALAFTMAIATALFAALGHNAGQSFMAFFVSPLTSLNGLTELGVKGAPLLMIAAGLAIAFRAGVSNIGAEGQLIMGAVAGGGVALACWDLSGPWILPLMMLAGIAGGMAWAAIPAFLRVRFAVSEILTSLMLTYVASLFLNLLVYGPWRDPEGMNFPQSRLFNDDETLGILVDGTRLHTGTAIALGLTLVAWFVMTRTLTGFRIRTVGASPAAARYAGFGTDRTIWLTLLASGGLAGLAGLIEVAGPIGQIIPEITPGYGFTAIIVAFLGRLHPLGIIPAALVVALSYIGGENAQVLVGLPKAVTGVVQGLLLFVLLASDFLVRYRLKLVRPAGAAA